MGLDVKLVSGPPVEALSREAAEKKLRRHPQVPKTASITVDEIDGRWVAAVVTSEGPAFEDDAPEEPKDEAPELDTESDSGEDDLPFPPEGEEGEGESKGEKAELGELLDLVHQIADALGLGHHEEGPIPGLDEDVPPPPGGELDGPPKPPHGAGPPGGKLKPGELPNKPGVTPLGAPSFASVSRDHPWVDVLGKTAEFDVEEPIGTQTLAEVERELSTLTDGTGYKIKRLTESSQNGKRFAKAIISAR